METSSNNLGNTYFFEDKRKHLEFIETTISRMSQCSSQVKTWTVALIGALIAVISAFTNANADKNSIVILISSSFLLTLIMWGLDSYYLMLERKFRDLYSIISQLSSYNYQYPPYTMKTEKRSLGKAIVKWLECVISPSEFFFYFSIMASISVVLTLYWYLKH